MKTKKNDQVQNDRTLATVPLSDGERKLVERMNTQDSARRATQPKFIRRLLSAPLVYW